MTTRILWIDDKPEIVARAKTALAGEVGFIGWSPKESDVQVRAAFDTKRQGVDLVVTDYDLTEGACTGLFGATIVGWCQSEFLPVVSYTRASPGLPKRPELYEIRPPDPSPEATAKYVISVAAGFRSISCTIQNMASLPGRGAAAVLAKILGRPDLEMELRYFFSNPTIGAALQDLVTPRSETPDARKQEILGYVIGHVLLNAVLPFPGPILSSGAAAAYLGISEAELNRQASSFSSFAYEGPFAEVDQFYWKDAIETYIERLGDELDQSESFETRGEMHRRALELTFGMTLERPYCIRCAGKNGGFLCPYSGKTVCQLEQCSIGTSPWIPRGASICRIEREFYDEWSPLLGF